MLASIIIPTRARPAYLEVALASVAAAGREAAGAEMIVVDDGGLAAAPRSPAALGARYGPLGGRAA